MGHPPNPYRRVYDVDVWGRYASFFSVTHTRITRPLYLPSFSTLSRRILLLVAGRYNATPVLHQYGRRSNYRLREEPVARKVKDIFKPTHPVRSSLRARARRKTVLRFNHSAVTQGSADSQLNNRSVCVCVCVCVSPFSSAMPLFSQPERV